MSTEGITRRRLIGTATAGTVGAGMATAPGAEAHRRRTRHVDVAVVGAGLAGHRGAGAGESAPSVLVLLFALSSTSRPPATSTRPLLGRPHGRRRAGRPRGARQALAGRRPFGRARDMLAPAGSTL